MKSADVRRQKAFPLVLIVALIGAVPFLITAPFCGLYLDDYPFFQLLGTITPVRLWLEFIQYVPGRNLHIPFFWALIHGTGGSVTAMHIVGVTFDALNTALMFLVILRLTGLRAVALAGAAAFSVVPNHGETHFWITNIPQCQIPTALALAALLLALKPGRLFAACAIYAVALFTYDQVFFLWPLLLAAAWSRDPKPRMIKYALASSGLLTLNSAHIAVRYLSPYAHGGRPLIRLSDFFDRCLDAAVSVRKGALPWPTSSHAHWAWTIPIAVAALATALWLARMVRSLAQEEAPELNEWTQSSGWLIAAVGGLAWTALAYAPNLFWFLSPRHNLLPSAGWSLTIISCGAYALSRWKKASPLTMIAPIFFAAAAVSGVHEGTQWIESRRLKDDYIAAVRRLTPPIDSLFLVDAPRHLRRAPAFNLPHDVVIAAERALGRGLIRAGDNEASPTRRGIVYGNDLTLLPADSFRWIPASEVNLIAFDNNTQTFQCVGALRVENPIGEYRELPLRGGMNCSSVLPMAADAYLLSSETGKVAATTRAAKRAAGLILAGARASTSSGTTRLELDWKVEKTPRTTLGYLFRVKDPSGQVVLDGVFPSHSLKSAYPMIWPLIDDEVSTLHLSPGMGLKQAFVLRRAAALPAGAYLELDAYELESGARAVPAGSLITPLSLN